MWRRRLIGVAVCALLAGCGESTAPRLAAPKPQAPKPTATPIGMVGAPSLAFTGPASAVEQQLVREADSICRSVGPIKPPSASTPLDARKAEMAREIRGLERLSSGLSGLSPENRRLQRLLGKLIARLDAQARLDRRIGKAAAAGDAQSVAIGMGQNAHNRAARNAIVERLGLSRCLRAREPT
jgi:hypothetical protein